MIKDIQLFYAIQSTLINKNRTFIYFLIYYTRILDKIENK